ncbi:DDB1- and CUL4-associated factor 6 [Blomia tropicalis]|nr:DDB1- and CUL4-associated factor 6 [Blomia tropicalis]
MDRRNFFYKVLYERNTLGSQPISIYNSAKNNLYLLQRMSLIKGLNVHSGCVNTICWNSTGQYLLSGSDDLHLCITDAFTHEIKARIRTGHVTNIFSAKYLPNTSDSQIVSCSGDGIIIYSDLNNPETSIKNIFDCQDESVYDIATVPNDSHSFLTCSHNRTVRWYDLRVKSSCMKMPSYSRFARRFTKKCEDDVLIRCESPVTAIAVNTLMPWQLAIGCSDSIIRIYDRRMLSTKTLGGNSSDQNTSVLAKFTYNGMKSTNRITSLAYSRNCNQILASYSNDHLYLFDINDVRNTIRNAHESDIISEKSDIQQPCSFKRFRLRGDWSDTGPNALPTGELRVFSGSSLLSRNPVSTPSSWTSSEESSNTSGSSTSTVASNNTANTERSNVHDLRIRHLNTILSLILRNGQRESSESLHSENNNVSSDDNTAILPEPLSGPSSSNSRSNYDSAANDPRMPPSTSSNSSSTSSNRSFTRPRQDRRTVNESATNNAASNIYHSQINPDFFIHIFGDDDDYRPSSPATPRYMDEDNEMNEVAVMEEEEDVDSDSVFNQNYSLNSNGNARFRSFSSSSNDSNRRVLRRTRSDRYSFRQRRLLQDSKPYSQSEMDENDNDKEKRLKTYRIRNFKTFVGHRNSRTVIKEATFWGDDYIVSGSDCGHIFFWSIKDCELAMILQGDHHVVNCLQPHPTDPILASSGIDYDIKIWSPKSEECLFDAVKAKKIIDRNKQMLEDSRDTVTVPARFVLSLFSTLRNRQQSTQNRDQGSGNNSRDDSWLNNDANMDDEDEVEL